MIINRCEIWKDDIGERNKSINLYRSIILISYNIYI